MFELTLHVALELVEPLSDALLEQGALSVSVQDAHAQTPLESPLYGEPGYVNSQMAWNRSLVVVLFEDEPSALRVAEDLKSGFQVDEDLDIPSNTQTTIDKKEVTISNLGDQPTQQITVHGVRPLAEQDWVRLTQSQFEPVQINDEFWIVPTWSDLPVGAKKVLRLDPGLAFGTGTHPTTQMCLKWIASHSHAQTTNPVKCRRVLDYGCGSGVLAMAAVLYEALEVDAVDIDPAAISSTLTNAQANNLHTRMRVGTPETASGEYDCVVANILASPLKVLAPILVNYVKSGGTLVLAGILERQATELSQAYAPYCELRVADSLDGWVLMRATNA